VQQKANNLSISNFRKHKLIILSLVFVILFFFLASITDALLTSFLRNSKHDDFTTWTKVIEGNASSDIVVFGSSRAMVHFDCVYIETKMDKTCVNLGLNGSGPIMQKPLMDLYYENNSKPNTTVISLDVTSFVDKQEGDVYNPPQYMPYLSNSTVFNNLTNIDKTYWKYKIPLYDFAIYKENLHIAIKTALGQDPDWRIRRDAQGFASMNTPWDGEFDTFKNKYPDGISYEVNIEKVKIVSEMIATAKENSENVVLVFPPVYEEFYKYLNNKDEILSTFTALSRSYDVKLVSFKESTISSEKDNFYNSQHLNANGAKKFNEVLVSQLNTADIKVSRP
jgi:hypothetical protein